MSVDIAMVDEEEVLHSSCDDLEVDESDVAADEDDDVASASLCSDGGAATASEALQSQLNCFLCAFGRERAVEVDEQDLRALLAELDRGIGHRDILAHARVIHLMYMNAIYVKAQACGRQLPVWRTKHVLEHLLLHDMRPRVQLWHTIRRFRLIASELKRRIWVRDADGQVHFNSATHREYLRTIKIIVGLYKTPTPRMLLSCDAAQVDVADIDNSQPTLQRFFCRRE